MAAEKVDAMSEADTARQQAACPRCGSNETRSAPLGRRTEIRCAGCGLFLNAPLTAEAEAASALASRMAEITRAGLREMGLA
jgi:uncharacterized Zn finger protein